MTQRTGENAYDRNRDRIRYHARHRLYGPQEWEEDRKSPWIRRWSPPNEAPMSGGGVGFGRPRFF